MRYDGPSSLRPRDARRRGGVRRASAADVLCVRARAACARWLGRRQVWGEALREQIVRDLVAREQRGRSDAAAAALGGGPAPPPRSLAARANESERAIRTLSQVCVCVCVCYV